MDNLIITDFIVLSSIALLAAIILYVVSQKFKIEEDPKIDDIDSFLPQANCGACGRAGCRDFASSCAHCSQEEFSGLYCSVGGPSVMKKIADYLGFQAKLKAKEVAVLRCNGNCENAPSKIEYNGITLCRIADKISNGLSGCPNGCLRLGDCVKVCKFGALSIDPQTKLPVVDENKCTACGACVNMCPRHLFEIRPCGPNGEKVYVACRNQQKGALARKNCKVACIACQKCAKICDKIKIENNLSYIPTDVSASQFGKQLSENCPTGSIVYVPAQPTEDKNA